MLFTIIVFIITLFILVISHELGHFLMAKKFGIKVLEFGFGLPPKAWGRRIGETVYSLNWLPIGGFVRLLGEEDEPDAAVKQSQKLRYFSQKPLWQRILVIIGGVFANFVLASLLFYIVLAVQGFEEKLPDLTSHKFFGVSQTGEVTILIGAVSPQSPAEQAGLAAGDRIQKFNGVLLESRDQLISQTKQHAGEKVKLEVIGPDNQLREVELTPRANPPANEGPIGVGLQSVAVTTISYSSPLQKLGAGFIHSYNLAAYSFDVLGKLISTSLATKNFQPVSETVAGPVGITNMAKMVLETKSPLIPYINFMALLSLNLAIVNILPFPALDGGRLFFLLIEGLFRKRVRVDIERMVHTVGMALLLALIILVTFSDIKKFF